MVTEADRTRAGELGVVDPMRFPAVDRLRREWSRLPLLGRAFVIAAAVDLLLRLSGLAGLSIYLDVAAPIAIVTAFLPHYAVLLFPAVILWRRPDAASATPLLLRGAVIVAAVRLLGETVPLWLSPGFGSVTPWVITNIVLSVAGAAGYLTLALGLKAIDGASPRPNVAGLANLVAALIAGAAIVATVALIARPNVNLGDPAWDAQVMLSSIVAQLSLLAFAYLARTILRGTSDLRRPRQARVLAATAMLLSGIEAFLTLSVGILVLVQNAFDVSIPVFDGGFVLALLGSGFVMLLVVVAFGLGLGDTSGRIRRGADEGADQTEPGTPAVAWPEPGGEVPTYRPESQESQA